MLCDAARAKLFNARIPRERRLIQTETITMAITWADIEHHRSRKSCWIAIHGMVYDVTGMHYQENPKGRSSSKQTFLIITPAEQVLSYVTLAKMPRMRSILFIHNMF